MATYTPINHGEPNWDKALNDNFAKIFGGGVTDDSGWVDCATLVNGAQLYSAVFSGDPENRDTAIKRRIINFGKQQLVVIAGTLGFKYEEIVPFQTTVIELPAGYRDPWYQANSILMPCSNGTARWSLNGAGTAITLVNYTMDGGKAGDNLWFPIKIMYVV